MILAYDINGKIVYDLDDWVVMLHDDSNKKGFTRDIYEKGKFVVINLRHKDDQDNEERTLNGLLLPKSAYDKITKKQLKKKLSADDWKYADMYMGAHIFSSWKYRIKEWLREQWIMIFHVAILGKMVHTDYELMELRKQTIKDYKEYMKILKEIKKRPDYDRNELFNYIEVL